MERAPVGGSSTQVMWAVTLCQPCDQPGVRPLGRFSVRPQLRKPPASAQGTDAILFNPFPLFVLPKPNNSAQVVASPKVTQASKVTAGLVAMLIWPAGKSR